MTNPPQVGQRAPALHLPTLDAQHVDLAAMRDGPVLVSFLRHAG